MDHRFGLFLLEALKDIGTPATYSEILAKLQTYTGINQNNLENKLRVALEGGVKHSYFILTDSVYYALSENTYSDLLFPNTSQVAAPPVIDLATFDQFSSLPAMDGASITDRRPVERMNEALEGIINARLNERGLALDDLAGQSYGGPSHTVAALAELRQKLINTLAGYNGTEEEENRL